MSDSEYWKLLKERNVLSDVLRIGRKKGDIENYENTDEFRRIAEIDESMRMMHPEKSGIKRRDEEMTIICDIEVLAKHLTTWNTTKK